VEALDERQKVGRKRTGEWGSLDPHLKSREKTAKIIGTSQATVQRVRTILDRGDEEIKGAVMKGKKSIRRAAPPCKTLKERCHHG